MLAPILECRAFVSGIYTFGSSMFSLSMCSLPHVYTLYSNDWPLVLGPIWNFHIDVKFTVRFIPVITRPLKVQSLMNRFFFSAAFPGAINISSLHFMKKSRNSSVSHCNKKNISSRFNCEIIDYMRKDRGFKSIKLIWTWIMKIIHNFEWLLGHSQVYIQHTEAGQCTFQSSVPFVQDKIIFLKRTIIGKHIVWIIKHCRITQFNCSNFLQM